eukprot:3630520-Alexandrium_andersonii.AAC.1
MSDRNARLWQPPMRGPLRMRQIHPDHSQCGHVWTQTAVAQALRQPDLFHIGALTAPGSCLALGA